MQHFLRQKWCGIALLCWLLLAGFLHAETVFTPDGRLQGKIVRQDSTQVILKTEAEQERVIPRTTILTIYDDAGSLIWKNPQIITDDPTPEKKLTLPDSDAHTVARKFAIGFSGGGGLSYANALFSAYPMGTAPAYALAAEIDLNGAYFVSNTTAWTFSLGWGQRQVPIGGLDAPNLSARGNAVWSIPFVDVRGGFRFYSGYFFLEPGMLLAIKAATTPASIATGSGTVTGSVANTSQLSYVAFSLALGVELPISDAFYFQTFVRVDQAVTPVISGSLPTNEGALDYNQQITVTSSAPVALFLLNATLQVSFGYRF